MSTDSDILLPREVAVPERDIVPLSSGGHGFVRRQWFDMMARHCFSSERIIMAEAQMDGARATLPLVDLGDRFGSLANYYSFSYGPVFEGAPDGAKQAALLGRIAVDLRRMCGRVSLYPLIEDESGLANLLRRSFAKAGWIALLTDQNGNHVLHLNGRNFAAYWKQRPGKLRSAVTRKGKGGRYGFEIHSSVTDELWQEYCAVYAASWKNAEPYPAMVRAIAQDAADRRALALGIARAGDQAVAAQIWTVEGDTGCIHKIAHDSAHDKGSPGTLLSHHMFRHMIDNIGVAHIDYGTGGNDYKRDWMEQERAMLRLECFDPRRAAMWIPALRTRISQLVRRPG